MKLLDVEHPFFRPLWRRIVIVVATVGWGLIELALGNGFWALVFGGIAAYCAYQFFVAFDPKGPDEGL